ncbi:MAG: SLBB domain-containing protein [Acidobacteriaceae bacterium]|nr:SLBB domain-containing protein [Acidobacteriaceae bacterium]
MKSWKRFLGTPVALVALSAALCAHAQVAGGGGGGAAGGGAAAGGAGTGLAGSSAGLLSNTSQSTGTNASRKANDGRADRTDDAARADVPAGSRDVLTEFQQMVESSTGRRLPIFGASLFGEVPTTYAPVEQVPVGNDYVIGPEDEINLQLSGQINQHLDLRVDRSGAISIPGVGAVQVAGLKYSELTPFLNRKLGEIYRNFTVSAQLGQLRSIQVFIVGQARRPGSYSISSLSTLLNAIFASGGPAPTGSVRNIEVKRKGQTIDHFDLYDLLLHGDKSHDVQLEPGDVIFYPFVGPQVAILGSVDVPAIYELKEATTPSEALKLAGGQTNVAAGSTVRLERVYEHQDRTVQDVQLSSTAHLIDGDILTVTSIIDRFRDAVTLRGNVANPGRYVWHQGMHLSDLFPNKESLITRNYWRKRNQLGQLQQDYIPQSGAAPIDTEGALQVHGNQIDRDAANVTQKGTATGDPGGNSVGAALTSNNGLFDAKTDVVLSAPDIDWNYAVIERQSTVDLSTSLIPFNLGRIILDHDTAQNYELEPGDVVTVFSKADLRVPSSQQTRFVRLEGEFVASGVYSVLPGETLRQLVKRAGGLTPDAYLYASEFTRESTRRVEQQRLSEYADELEAQISASTSNSTARAITPQDQVAATASASDAQTAVARLRRLQPSGRIVLDLTPNSRGLEGVPDIALEDGDRFVVPRVPSNVNVQGQVYSANAFLFAPHQRVLDYMKRAGGPDRQADKRRTFVLRADGSVVSNQYADVRKVPIFPGDTVVVPPNLDRRALFQKIVDISYAAGQIGWGVAAVYLVR